MSSWTTERIAEQFCREVRQRFEAENAKYRAEDAADRERCQRERPKDWARLAKSAPHLVEVRDSGLWQDYCDTRIDIYGNSVRVVLPNVYFPTEALVMFGDTSVAWSKPTLSAEVIDGIPLVVVHLFLVTEWSDAQAAEWVREHSERPVGCQHEQTVEGASSPMVYGSHATEVCRDCGAFRTHGHDAARSHMSAWRPASEYAAATEAPEDM